MGLFDFFKKGSNKPPPGKDGDPPKAVDKKVSGPAKVVADKRAQAYDRIEAIQQLCELKSVEAATALLKRFTFAIDPSITDQEEKEVAYQGIIAVGLDVVPAVLTFCERAEVLTWPVKILRALLDDDAYVEHLTEMLAGYDTEYSRNVEPKVQLITALEAVRSSKIREAVEPFLDDVNETVRFHAVDAIVAQGDEAALEPLLDLCEREESVRVKNRVAEGLERQAWTIPEPLRDKARESLQDCYQFVVDEGGRVRKRG